jgi:hypothetical protein
MGYLEFLAAGAAPVPAPTFPDGARCWSDATAWEDGVPLAGAQVRIPAGRTVVLDQDVDLASLEIEGTLLVAARDTQLRAGWVLVHRGGRLAAGTTEQPFREHLTITLCGGEDAAPHPDLGIKFLAALDGGAIDLHGQQRTSWVNLGTTLAPGHCTLRLAQPVDWHEGERIAIVSGQDHSLVEERTIVDVGADCMSVTLDQAVWHRHHGQHAAAQVLPGAVAKALLLERNIVVEGCADSARSSFGGFCMIAGSMKQGEVARRAIGRFSGVEFRRMGQFNRPGRYPLHWHNNGDAAESCVSGCLVQDSYQRGIVSVGSRHVRISGNVVMKPYGHGYIVESEDHSPQLTTTNLAVRPRVARFADAAMRRYGELKPRAFWIVRSVAGRPAAH